MRGADLLKLQGQVNALAHAWLYLAAASDMANPLPPLLLESLCATRWVNPEINAEAQRTLHWLAQQHDAAKRDRALSAVAPNQVAEKAGKLPIADAL